MTGRPDVLVCGAGPWGLAAAWRCARTGALVTLVDDGGTPAAHVAAGMLGARSEADGQDPALLDLLADGLARWPGFSDDLAADAQMSVGDRYPGSLFAASRPEHVAIARRAEQLLADRGRPASWLAGSDVRRLEPALAPVVAGALDLPEEGEVDPRRLLLALRAACARRGVATIAGRVSGLAPAADGVRLADGRELSAGAIVVAAGHAASRISAGPKIRPVKGQILRLRHPDGATLARTIRTPDVYLVPRVTGEVVVGATVEERGDEHVTAGAVSDLLEDAIRVCPELAEAELAEASAGLRPAASDGRPVLGRENGSGPVWAVGGFRHGVLLAPLAAEAVTAELAGQSLPGVAASLAPGAAREVQRTCA